MNKAHGDIDDAMKEDPMLTHVLKSLNASSSFVLK